MQETVGAGHSDYTGSKMGMWFFLFTEMILFGGLFLLYSVYRTQNPDSFHAAARELDLILGTANTFILITSSLTMALSLSALQNGNRRASLFFLGMTVLLGGIFLVNKYVEWGTKIHHGIYPNAPSLLSRGHGEILFFGLYYVMTGLHGLHVLAGIVLLSFMFVPVVRGTMSSANCGRLENSGLYWHLVDMVWIYLFPMFYLIT